MDLQMFLNQVFYYQLVFILIIFFASFILSKYLKFIAKKKISSQEIFKLVLLAIYVHIEPSLFYIIFIILLTISYFINFLQTATIGLICIVQIIFGLIFIIRLISSILKR